MVVFCLSAPRGFLHFVPDHKVHSAHHLQLTAACHSFVRRLYFRCRMYSFFKNDSSTICKIYCNHLTVGTLYYKLCSDVYIFNKMPHVYCLFHQHQKVPSISVFPFRRFLESSDMGIWEGKTPNVSPSFYNPSAVISGSHLVKVYAMFGFSSFLFRVF